MHTLRATQHNLSTSFLKRFTAHVCYPDNSVQDHRERVSFYLLIILGLLPRLALISRFPTAPYSDFANLVAFGTYLRDHGLATHDAVNYWQGFNVGLPLILAGMSSLFPSVNPGDLARVTTAFAMGLVPVLPYVIWRGVFSFPVRVLTAVALALWPGQVLFSGVVAQDNWVLPPAVALGALAARALTNAELTRPIFAGLVYCAGVAVRSDMLLMLLPLLLAAVRVDLWRVHRKQVLAGALATMLALIGLAEYRRVGSGRFTLATEYSGLAILGAFIPGSTANGWEPPYAYLASARPALLQDRRAMLSQSASLGIHEALRRPGFHLLRVLSSLGTCAIDGEATNLFWSLEAAGVLPAPLRERGNALAGRAVPLLKIEMALIQALFLAAMVVGVRRRNSAVLVLGSAVLLKYGMHAVGVIQGRYFLVATAVEILTIAAAAEELMQSPIRSRLPMVWRGLAAGAALALALFFLAPRLAAYVRTRDVDRQQHTYRFSLTSAGAELACTVDHGVLTELWPPLNATLRTFDRDPAPGEEAAAVCELTGPVQPVPVMLQVFDHYAPGGMGGRMVQRVELDGAEVLSHDIGLEPGTGWNNVPLGQAVAGAKRKVVIAVKALRPEPGQGWGEEGRVSFQLAAGAVASANLALGKRAGQSSTVAPASAGAAVDGNQDGNFYDGSVTHTKADPAAWWEVDLSASETIGSIVIWNRTDCCSNRLADYWVFVSDTPFRAPDTPAQLQHRAATWSSHQTAIPNPSVKIPAAGAHGRYVRVQLNGTNNLSLAEVQVFGQ